MLQVRNIIQSVVSMLIFTFVTACSRGPDLARVEMSFAAGTTGSGAAQTSTPLMQSEFGKRIRAAVQTSPALTQSDTELDIARANRDAAKGEFLPQISLGLNARSERIASDLADVSPYLRVSQLVYDGGAAAGNLTAARARILESRGSQLQTASATALAAIETYVLLLNRREVFEITRDNVTVHEDIEQQVAERVAKGAGSTADLMTARSRAADARTRFADAKARTDRAEARYREIFGAAPGRLPLPVAAPDLQRSDTQIIMDSPQVRQAEAAVLAAVAEQAAARARRNPEIRVAAFANQDRSRDANFGLDLAVNYQIDSTGQRRAAIAASDAQVAQSQAAREQLIRDIERELSFIRSDQQAGAERLREARIAARANADSVTAARAQFSIGRRSMIEILDAQRDYVNAQERLILAEHNSFLTNYAALSLTGDILDLLGVVLKPWDGSR